MTKQTVAFATLGCKVNQYDTQAMRELFLRAGYEAAPFSSVCDVYVINTCTVTGTGDQKSRQMIRRAASKNPHAAIIVTGCMAQRAAESLLLPGVRLVLGTKRRGEVVSLLEEALMRDQPIIAVESLSSAGFEPLSIAGSEGRTRATLKIQEGCNGKCAYCIIPSVRGKPRSRPLSDIAEETRRLSAAGFSEIVLTGIHLSSYGIDLPGETTLIDALREIHSINGVKRIRIGSLEPRIITPEFAKALSEMDTICPQFMLALQSGCDSVLSRMKRRYTTAQYEQAVAALREFFPDMALTSDIMTGFPGETDAEFAETMDFVARMGFSRIHVFPFSEREGTVAASMPGKVPVSVREARAKVLIALGETLSDQYMARSVGRAAEVLFEEASGRGATGYTREYIKTFAEGAKPGEIHRVMITASKKDLLLGEIIGS